MGDNHQYGRGDGTDDDSQDAAPRGYGQPDPGAGNRGYGRPDPRAGGGRGYGSPQQPPQAGQPGQPPQSSSPYSDRGYGGSPGYDRPVNSYNSGGASRRGPQQPIRGEVVPGGGSGGGAGGGTGSRLAPGREYGSPNNGGADNGGADNGGPDYGASNYGSSNYGGSGNGSPDQPGDPDFAGGYSTSLPPPRRSRLEERQAARAKGGNSAAASQERSGQYERSPLDGRSTRNGAARPGAGPAGRGPGGKRPVKKTGYHRYFDYPRTGKVGWRHWAPSIKQVSSFMLGGFFLLIGLVAFEYYSVQIPENPTLQQASIFDYGDGSTQFASSGQTTRVEVSLAQVPTMMQNAIVSAENKTFWSDPGVSYTGIVRSVLNDAEGKPLQGGSTLTQQYVKNAFLTDNQTFSRKLDEIFISLKISKSESKQWVLEHYLNTVDFGRGASGVEAAAKLWLGEDISAVNNPSDAALLASLVNAPSTFTTGYRTADADQTDAQALVARWKYVIGQMVANKYITQAQANAAVFPLTKINAANVQTETTPVPDLQMEDAVNSWLDQWGTTHPTQSTPTADQIGEGGYTVVTTFNQHDMDLAAQAVQDQLLSKLNSSWYDQNLYPGLAAVNPKNGDLIAFYGGSTEENNATQRQVQPGSTFKAFTLATAYSEGYSEDSYMDGTNPWPDPSDPNDAQILATGSYATVHNDGASGPHLSFDTATADSVNTAFVRTEQEVGPSKVLGMVNAMGINSSDSLGLNDSSGLTLGIASVSPARMADAYSTFPDNGTQYPLVEVEKVINDVTGQVWTPTVTPTNPITATVAQTVTSTLTHVTHDPGATACGTHSDCATTQTGLQNIAGKTGTSTMDFTGIDGDSANLSGDMQYLRKNSYTTAAIWFNGYTPNLEVAVDVSRWVTDSTGKAVEWPVDNINGGGNAFGAQYPLSIWAEFLKSMQSDPVVGGDPAFTPPAPDPSASILNSPTATPTPTATATMAPTPTAPDTTSDCATDQGGGGNGGFLGGGGNGGGGGNQQCATNGPSNPPPTTPTNTPPTPPATVTSTKHGFGGGGAGTG